MRRRSKHLDSGPDLFFAGGECLERFGTLVRRTDQVEDLSDETATRNSVASAIGRDGVLRDYEVDLPRVEFLNETDLDATRNLDASSSRMDLDPWGSVHLSAAEAVGSSGFTRFQEDSATDFHYRRQTFTKPTATALPFSYQVKVRRASEPTRDFATVHLWGPGTTGIAGGIRVRVNLVDGTFDASVIGGAAVLDSVTIAPSASGLRVLIIGTTDDDPEWRIGIFPYDGNGSDNRVGDGVSAIEAGFSQLEYVDAPTNYQPTPRNEDRQHASLLLEAAAENFVPYSEDFTQSVWTKNDGLVITAGQVAAPFGGLADEMEDTSAADISFLRDSSLTIPDDTDSWVASYYVQRLAGVSAVLSMQVQQYGGVTKSVNVQINPITGDINSADGTVVEEVSAEWLRVWQTWDATGGGNVNMDVSFRPTLKATIAGANDATLVGSQYVWGVQVERGSAPSSYIPTAGVAVTRAEDLFFAPFEYPPAPMTWYCKVLRIARGIANDAGLVHLGSSGAGSNARFHIVYEELGLNFEAEYSVASGVSTRAASVVAIEPGDLCEVVATMYPDFSLQIGQSINGGPFEQGGRSGPLEARAAYALNRVYLNSRGTSSAAFWKHLAVKANRGVLTLEEMRVL